MSEHTPGPWTAGPASSIVGQAVMAGIVMVAAVPSGEANAALIAAAPDLLAACKALLSHPAMKASPFAILDARDAIAKAEGRQ